MIETQRYFGRIIFPDSEKEIENIWLTIDQNKIFVDLPDPDLEVEDWGVVWGEFTKLGTVSLLDCGLGSQLIGFGGNQRKLVVHKLVQGVKLASVNDDFIDSIKLSCPTLNDWIFINEHIEFVKNQITIPEVNNLFEVNCKKFKIEFIVGYGGTQSFKEICLKRGLSINASFKEPIDIRDFYVWKRRLELLIVLLTNEDPQLEITNLNNTHHKIYGIDSVWQANRFAHGIDFHYSDVSQQLPKLFQNWFEKGNLSPIIELLLEKKTNPDLSIPRYFLNMCVATESLHRDFINKDINLIDNTIIEKREKIKSLITDDEDLLKWFRDKSSFWKNPELFDRLMDLKSVFTEIVGETFGIEIEKLLKMIKGTRHKLAHEGKHNTHFKDEFSLFLAGYSLDMLLQYHVIKILGIQDEAILNKFLESASQNVKMLGKINNYKGIQSEIEN